MQVDEFFSDQNVLDIILKDYKFSQDTRLTGGILMNGKRSYKLWSSDESQQFEMLPYEIGSITKTFTGILMARAVYEGKAKLEDSISKYIVELPKDRFFPSIKQIVTHTSGLPQDNEDDSDDLKWEETNEFNRFTRQDLITRLSDFKFENKTYKAEYSNMGASICGLILERIYNKKYVDLINDFTKELELKNTHILNKSSDIHFTGVHTDGVSYPNWVWSPECAYIPAGAIVSNVEDVLSYAEHIINNTKPYFDMAVTPLTEFSNDETPINIGYYWLNIGEYDILYHNGGTGCFNCSLAIDRNYKNALCMLSNQYMRYDGSFVIALLNKLRKELDK